MLNIFLNNSKHYNMKKKIKIKVEDKTQANDTKTNLRIGSKSPASFAAFLKEKIDRAGFIKSHMTAAVNMSPEDKKEFKEELEEVKTVIKMNIDTLMKAL